MIDRRRFVQSMIALGAASSVRPSGTLFAAQTSTELRDLADAALASAKKVGASYADIRINRYRVQFIFTRDRRVQNIVNTEDYGFGVRVIVDGTWGFASSSVVTKEEIARVAAQAAGIAKANRRINEEPVRLAPVRGVRHHLEHAGQEEPVRHAAAAEARSAPADSRGSAQGAGRELRVGVHAVRQRAQVLCVDGRLAHRAVADTFVSVLLGDRRRQGVGQVLLASVADLADGHGLRVRRGLPAPQGSAASRPRKPWRCTRRSRPRPDRRR